MSSLWGITCLKTVQIDKDLLNRVRRNLSHGAYFADDPKKSHGYTAAAPTDQTHVMYYCKVVLGVESRQTTTNQQLASAPKDTHSVIGTLGGFTEYIVYRYGQALPYMKITYKT
ncbi:unnamed protein product [Rotaria magnacalcarata]